MDTLNNKLTNHTKTIEMLYGSHEAYLNSPQLKHVKLKVQDLVELQVLLISIIDNIHAHKPWYHLKWQLRAIIFKCHFKKVLLPDVEELASKYQNQVMLPVPFLIKELDRDYESLMCRVQSILTSYR